MNTVFRSIKFDVVSVISVSIEIVMRSVYPEFDIHYLSICVVNSSSATLQIATYIADVDCSEFHFHWSSLWTRLARRQARDFSNNHPSV